MRPMEAPQSQQYQKKASTRKIVWFVILIFALYSAYAIVKPLVIMYIFVYQTDKICDEKRLMVRELDFNPIIAEIRTAVDSWAKQGLSMTEGGITYKTEGGINHITIVFATEGSWCGVKMHYDWDSKYMSAKKRTGY